jgi:hypothetical protein
LFQLQRRTTEKTKEKEHPKVLSNRTKKMNPQKTAFNILKKPLAALWVAAVCFLAVAPTLSRAAEPQPERNFYDVLEDVLGDFEYDLKNGNVTGLKDLSIRNIAVSENVPASFKGHLELLITERVLKNTKAKIVQCLACKARRTSLSGDQVVISSPENNPAELARIAKSNGIEHFMDVAFAYQASGIVLSMTTTEPETGSIVWSRSYNSESSRAAAFRRGVDFSQADDARKSTEYTPTLQYRGSVYYLFEPNLSGMSGCLAFGFRMVERYDNRKKEVGFEANYMKDSSTLINSSSSTAAASNTDNLYSGFNATLLFVHGWNFIGEEENYNKVRANVSLGVGGTYASGYLGALIRANWEWRLGKHFAVTATGGYRPASTAFVGTFATDGKSVSGAEIGIGISLLK